MKKLRFALIEALIITSGSFQRNDLITMMKMSSAKATRTISFYQEKSPTNIRYDSSEKCYVKGEEFVPVLFDDERHALQFLKDIMGYEDGDKTFRNNAITAWILNNGSMSRAEIKSVFLFEDAQVTRTVADYKKLMPTVKTESGKGLCFPKPVKESNYTYASRRLKNSINRLASFNATAAQIYNEN
jgi:hypothetical protein